MPNHTHFLAALLAVVTVFGLSSLPGGIKYESLTHEQAKAECEKTLPRNQECTFIYVPKEILNVEPTKQN